MSLGACSKQAVEPFVVIPDEQKSLFLSLEGTIHIQISHKGKDIGYCIQKASVKQCHDIQHYDESAHIGSAGGAKMLTPDPPEGVYEGPYAFSKSGKRAIASFGNLGSGAHSTKVALLNRETAKITSVILAPQDSVVYAMAWAPHEEYFAILFVHYEKVGGEIIANLSGHPPSISTFYLGIYDLFGRQIALGPVIHKAHNPVVWLGWAP
jgi:hypothetical protein